MIGELDRFRSALATLVRADAVPELVVLPLRRARIVSQGVDGRVSLQMVDRSGEAADTLPVSVWMGVPGVSADHTPGQELVLGFAQAEASDPVAFLSAPKGQPGHIPIRVRHEATTEIRFCGSSAGSVKVGPEPTSPVALGPALDQVVTALRTLATSLSLLSATPLTPLLTIGRSLQDALSPTTLPPTSATRLGAS